MVCPVLDLCVDTNDVAGLLMVCSALELCDDTDDVAGTVVA